MPHLSSPPPQRKALFDKGPVGRHGGWQLALLALWLWACSLPAQAGPWLINNRPTARAHEAVEILADAASEGLEPEDYGAGALAQAVAAATHGAALNKATAQQLENALSTALQRFLSDLHSGRVDPRAVHQDYSLPAPTRTDPAQLLQQALAAPTLHAGVRAAAPQLPQYAQLRSALAQYRALGAHPAWAAPLPPLLAPAAASAPKTAAKVTARKASRNPKLDLGQEWVGLPLLVQRLVALGDLPPDTPVPARYDESVQNGVKAFQERHALDPDGVIGQATLEALSVPPAARAQQIALAMERLRWTPLLRGPRMIVINVPEFMLRAYEQQDGRIVLRLAMKVIVGKALNTRTPLFDEDMRFIEFSPYWNIPPSIARSETIPRLRRDPSYFEREGLEFVDSQGGVHTTLSPAHLDAVLRGQMRIRQRPGPRNALGDIKFIFPNNSNIYLHHTPATQLFARPRRDFSHGCIRVEDPVALARFVLQNDPAWPEERIREAMAAGKSSTIRLAEPIPVVIAYITTVIKQGKVHFFADLYGHDRLLAQALREQAEQRRAAPLPVPVPRIAP
ncbi:murein L,D-transpeptidase YcbB/YkuD [Extensimonas vulgaris]|uniref:Murein L,D-transpeptidase YcbB/YkuD n=1 Tax=Extensimonas vulgaris TaxID=1031594 RepID=A0A369AUC8_9BURK|nr:murein L,D-transpeptidase YcbB/YkuD [Extensimonas vulgaris]TWI39053.1 murein L,D-transpeptidase YcbB/YkuD [Extensimonas vulgaris]TXD15306.1 L,D-transpeptidase family protein [Extensimonas vulgaris]